MSDEGMKDNPIFKSIYSHCRKHREGSVILLLFSLFFATFFHKGLISGTFYTIGDQFAELHPLRRAAWDMIRQGSLPLWTPYIFSGYPLLSMAQNGLAYPLTWGYLFLPSQWAEQIIVLAPFLLAPIFTYLYVRALGKSRLAGILAGLCFGYGGFMASWMTNGLMTNAVMWLPLILIPILKASNSRFIPCLLWAFAAYLMSVLNGTGQGFVWVGITALSYGFYLSAVETVAVYRSLNEGRPKNLLRCWRPLAVAVGAVTLAAGAASFQIFESWTAKTLSIRDVLGVERFNDLTYSPMRALKAFLAPLFNYVESTPFVPLGVAVLALAGVIIALRELMRNKHLFLIQDPQLSFWVIAAIVFGLLMLGSHTFLYSLLRHIPIVNSFRGPSRLSFGWTFALAILAAYGWDAVTSYVKPKHKNIRPDKTLITGVVIFILTIIVGYFWISGTPVRIIDANVDFSISERRYLLWKAAFTSLSLFGLWFPLRLAPSKLRTLGLCVWIAVACFFDPYINQTRWWGKYTLTADRMTRISPAQRWLQQYSPEENRIYTRVRGLDGQIDPEPLDIDSPNLTILAGLHNVAGYEPLIMRRYSRALGDVGIDGVTVRDTVIPSDSPLDMKSHVLDLLNMRFLVTYKDLSIDREEPIEKDGIRFVRRDLPIDLLKDGAIKLDKVSCEADTLALVTTLVDSVAMENGTPVARVEIQTEDGQTISRDILAGVHTAEWAYERSGVRAVIRHALPPVFDTTPAEEQNTFPAHRYLAVMPLGQRHKIDDITIKKIPNTAPLKVWKAGIYDSVTKSSVQLYAVGEKERISKILDPDRWTEVHRTKDTIIYRNSRAMPRVWLVGEVKVVEPEESLRTITGDNNATFDPHKLALIETDGKPAPFLSQLSNGNVLSGASAKITSYKPNELKIETSADQPSFLVVSETNYPGWIALIDGKEEPIFQTDYLLRGVALPEGRHTIEMKYTASWFWKGVYFSLLTLLIIVALAAYEFSKAPARYFLRRFRKLSATTISQ